MKIPREKLADILAWLKKDGPKCLASFKEPVCAPCLDEALEAAYTLGYEDRDAEEGKPKVIIVGAHKEAT